MQTTKALVILIAIAGCGSGLSVRAASTLYDSGDPTASEQLVLEMINRARANPTAEGTRLQINITEGLAAGSQVVVRPPLAMNKNLLTAARDHSADMYARSYFDHEYEGGPNPFERMIAAGYQHNAAGENIAAATFSGAANLEDALMIDQDYFERGHRANLLGTDSITGTFSEIGIGYFTSSITNQMGYGSYLTQDFGLAGTTSFLVGVVYNDANGNNFYDIGEGMSGVTVMPSSGNFYAITSTSGGYAFPVASSGQITITASGGALAAQISKTVTLEGINLKVDFKASEAGGTTGGGGVVAPIITSSANTSGTVGVAFSYQITASGTAPITFSANSLPAFLTLNGDTLIGTPTSAGTFIISVGASNSSGSDSVSVIIQVAPGNGTGGNGGTGTTAPVIGNTIIDTDSDGFPDEIETALGFSTTDGNATPFGGSSAGVAQNLQVKTLAIKLNFSKPLTDSIKMNGSLPIPAAFVVAAGQQVTVDIAGVVRTFTLDAKFASPKSTTESFKLRIKSKSGLALAQDGKFSFKIAKSTLASLLSDENMVNGNITANPIAVPVIILFNGKLYRVDQQRLWYAKQDKSGKIK